MLCPSAVGNNRFVVCRSLVLLLTLCIVAVPRLFAHTPGQSYLFTNITEYGLHGRLEIPIDVLQRTLQEEYPEFRLDKDGVDENQWALIEDYLRSHLRISQHGVDYTYEFGDRDALEIEIADFLVVQYVATAPGPIPDNLSIRYSAFFHALESHRIGLVIENNFKTGLKDNHLELSYFFAPGREDFVLNTRGDHWFEVFLRFVVEGMVHIAIGIDHVLFIITLLLMSVVAKAGRRFEPVATLKPALIKVFKLVTLFTIAHTITLFLGLKGWVDLPSQIVEPIIALSIVVVALNNIFPIIEKHVGVVIFGFGLFHGLGFAGVLLELALGPNAKLLSLLGFNIGVELGQLFIVFCLFPILFVLRERWWYNPLILRTCSAGIALVGAWWFVSRAITFESSNMVF